MDVSAVTSISPTVITTVITTPTPDTWLQSTSNTVPTDRTSGATLAFNGGGV
jgi:hypothetical protein